MQILGDRSTCLTCGRSWDTNDYDPPPCLPLSPTEYAIEQQRQWDQIRLCSPSRAAALSRDEWTRGKVQVVALLGVAVLAELAVVVFYWLH